jgi:effector-binding domain-containing protein
MELNVHDVPARSYVVLSGRVPRSELTQAIPARIEESGTWVFANGGPTGAPMASVGMPDADGTVELEVGWPAAPGADPPAPFTVVTYPASRAVVHRHIGPYELLPQTYEALSAAIAAAGLTPGAPVRESYETNPQEVPDPADWVTEIVWPIA